MRFVKIQTAVYSTFSLLTSRKENTPPFSAGKVQVEMCAKCGSLKWVFSGKQGRILAEVGDDGRPAVKEWRQGDLQRCSCALCGGNTITLLGPASAFKNLKKLSGKERFLKMFELAIDHVLIIEDPRSLRELLDTIRPSKFGGKFGKTLEGLIAVMKLMEK